MSVTDAAGFNPRFLGPAAPLPQVPPEHEPRELAYTHFTVLLDPARRLAAATAVNIDGSALRDLGRGDDWHLDPRVPESEQAGPALYARNDLDRGHLVRRRDPVWGPDAAGGTSTRSATPTLPRRRRSSTSPRNCGTGWKTTSSPMPTATGSD